MIGLRKDVIDMELPYLVPPAPPLSAKAIANAANNILMRHGQSALRGCASFDVMQYLEFHMVTEHEFDYAVRDLGYGVWAETRQKMVTLSPQTYEKAIQGQGFARFTVAHEIGHAVLHQRLLMTKLFHSSSHGDQLSNTEHFETYCHPEWQANEFAAAVLMPQSGMSLLRQRYVRREEFLAKVTDVFKVSPAAASYRLEKLMRRGKISF